MIERRSVSDLLKEPILDIPEGKKPIRLITCGVPAGVDNIVHSLHVLGFADVGDWSRRLPSPTPGEVIRILTRFITID